MHSPNRPITRRSFLSSTAATAGAAFAAGALPAAPAIAGAARVKVGLLLPYSGTYAMLGNAITDGLKLRLAEAGGKLGGREVEFVVVDSEMSVPKAPQNTSKLIGKEKVDFLVGPVHSGIAAAMARIVGAKGAPILIVPNAGSNAVTRQFCAPNIFRTSFSNWQPAYPGGKVMADDGHKTAVTIAWKYAAGIQMMQAGRTAFEKAGGKVIKDILVPFPSVEFQAYLSEIAALKPDAVYAFFSGGGAVKFVKDYAAAGLKDKIALYGPGFLTEGVSRAQGAAAEGVKTTLHYADNLDLPANKAFRAAYKKAYGKEANVFAVQGYDTGSLLLTAMEKVKGDTGATKEMIATMEAAKLKSPRGDISFSKAHNVVQDIYLRKVVKGEQQLVGVVARQLADPAQGCRLA